MAKPNDQATLTQISEYNRFQLYGKKTFSRI